MNIKSRDILSRFHLYHLLLYIFHYKQNSKLIVLNYHRISDRKIRKHLEFLKRYFKFIDTQDFCHVFSNQKKQKENLILLTFDDGYRSFFTDVYPVLKDLEIPALVFLPTSLVGTEELIWTDYLRVSILETASKSISINREIYELSNKAQRKKIYRYFSLKLKQTDEEKRRKIVSEFVKTSHNLVKKEKYSLLTWDQVQVMSKNKIEFGSHSHTHPILSTVSEEQLRKEIELSKKIIEKEIGSKVLFFAYPNGKRSDYNQQVIELIKEQGYRYAFTTIQGKVSLNTNPYEIKRILLFEKHSLLDLALKILIK